MKSVVFSFMLELVVFKGRENGFQVGENDGKGEARSKKERYGRNWTHNSSQCWNLTTAMPWERSWCSSLTTEIISGIVVSTIQ